MAAFYFDYILIQHVSEDKYSFMAMSNPGIGTSQLATAVPKLGSREVNYLLPDPAIGNTEIVYPPTEIDFKNYITYDAVHLGIKYPEYNNVKDIKGEFCIKDTDYPPPRMNRHLLENLSSIKSSIDQKIQLFTGVITQRFKFNRIILKRIIDQTYTIEIELKDPGAFSEYVPVSLSYESDSSRSCYVLVLAVRKDPTNASSTLIFKNEDIIISMEDKLIPIIIYDIDSGAVKDIPWNFVYEKNAHLNFD